MKRKLLTGLAFAGMVAGFASAIRDLFRFAEQYCGAAEAGGNCRGFARLYAQTDILIFTISAVALALLLLLPKSRPTDE